ncbi:MAG: hypothetical protein HZA07_05520 [Nitrospirae bacterium]|nr:hypothetical protein [Nitrospirota bacterium]
MIRTGSNKNMLSFIVKFLCIALLLFGVFGLVWLRSSITTLEYNLGDLEKKKMEHIKERKRLLAERASLLSPLHLTHGFVFPDRVRVIHVKKQRGPAPYRVALERKGNE